jgi:predicted oxidoreductase|tara:strand:+ start:2905 stop:3759 length:855 start_codon:yes stop_codon:yes gene_type:complete
MNLSRIISGTMNWGVWGVNHSKQDMCKLISESFDSGINSFDHADIYGGYTTEQSFGDAFAETGINREDVFFISKCGIIYPSEKLPVKTKHYDYSEDHINKSVDNSLKNLRTDYLDCLLLHRPSPLMDISIIADTLKRLIKSGKIKSFGVSNFTANQMDMFKGKVDILYNQINLSLTHLDHMFDGTLEYMQANNILPMAYSPLGSYFKEENSKIKEVVEKLKNKYDCTDYQLIISWLLKHPSKVYPVVGTTKSDRIKSTLESLKIEIDLIDWFELLEASVGKRVP